jgi:class 3 adenylate cyclase
MGSIQAAARARRRLVARRHHRYCARMARLQRKNFSTPDEVRDVGRGELKIVEIADTAIGRISYQPGWRWSTDVRPRVGTASCQVHHIGVVISGRLTVEMVDGSMLTLGPEAAFEIPPGHDAWVAGDEPWVSIDTVGRRHFGAAVQAQVDRYLATILFVDIVGSTELATRLGDRAWRDLLADHNSAARQVIDRYRGLLVDTIGDGLLATFDGPARSVHAALDIHRTAGRLGLEVRAGMHTGEVERSGEDVRGIAVHHAARVAGAATAGETLVSSATRVLLSGAGIDLESTGLHELKGIEEPDTLYRVRPPAA